MSRIEISVETFEQGRQVGDERFQLHLDAIEEVAAGRAKPFKAVHHARRTGAFDDEATAIEWWGATLDGWSDGPEYALHPIVVNPAD